MTVCRHVCYHDLIFRAAHSTEKATTSCRSTWAFASCSVSCAAFVSAHAQAVPPFLVSCLLAAQDLSPLSVRHAFAHRCELNTSHTGRMNRLETSQRARTGNDQQSRRQKITATVVCVFSRLRNCHLIVHWYQTPLPHTIIVMSKTLIRRIIQADQLKI